MERRFGVELTEGLAFEPTYNAAPSQDLPVIIPAASGRTLVLMRWGLVPWWVHDEKIGYELINARSDRGRQRSNPAPLDLIEHDLIRGAAVELDGAQRLMRPNDLCLLDRAAVDLM